MQNNNDVNGLIKQLKHILRNFHEKFGVKDIITNSKIFEVLIADSLDHILIPGHSGSRDAKDKSENEFEYKHYKESSSNHTWTFNDFSNTTIAKLVNTKSVIFAHIQDVAVPFPEFDWYYEVPGVVISQYLAKATTKIKNNRKMINVGPKQISESMGITRHTVSKIERGPYTEWIKQIVEVATRIETLVGTTGVLTSNKFWEVLVALRLGHQVQSEQAKHDAVDLEGNTYEYKVAKGYSWSFQDISRDVLNKYLQNKSIILASVDKEEFEVKKIYEADPIKVVRLLKIKLRQKAKRYRAKGKKERRVQASLGAKDLRLLRAKLVFPGEPNNA